MSTVFSAAGLLSCDLTHSRERSIRIVAPYSNAVLADLEGQRDLLEAEVMAQFRSDGMAAEAPGLRHTVGLKFRQQIHTIHVPVPGGHLSQESWGRVLDEFSSRYASTYGEVALLSEMQTEADVLRVAGRLKVQAGVFGRDGSVNGQSASAPVAERMAYFRGEGLVRTPVYRGESLRAGDRISGPGLIERMGDTVVVDPGWMISLDEYRTLRLSPQRAESDHARAH